MVFLPRGFQLLDQCQEKYDVPYKTDKNNIFGPKSYQEKICFDQRWTSDNFIMKTNMANKVQGASGQGRPSLQGSILGPLFFLVYRNGLCDVPKFVDLILFADDIKFRNIYIPNTMVPS